MRRAAGPVLGSEHLLAEVLRHLPLPDLLRAGSTGRAWRDAARRLHRREGFWHGKFRWEIDRVSQLYKRAAGSPYGQPGKSSASKCYSTPFKVATFPW